MCGSRSISSPNVRRFYCKPSSVPSDHDSAIFVVAIRCPRSYYKEQWMAVVTEGRPRKSWKDNIKEWTGRSMLSLLYIANDGGHWGVITADASVGVPQQRLGVTGISLSALIVIKKGKNIIVITILKMSFMRGHMIVTIWSFVCSYTGKTTWDLRYPTAHPPGYQYASNCFYRERASYFTMLKLLKKAKWAVGTFDMFVGRCSWETADVLACLSILNTSMDTLGFFPEKSCVFNSSVVVCWVVIESYYIRDFEVRVWFQSLLLNRCSEIYLIKEFMHNCPIVFSTIHPKMSCNCAMLQQLTLPLDH